MRDLSLGVLVLGHPDPKSLEIGGNHVLNLSDVQIGQYSVIAFDIKVLLSQDPQFLKLAELSDQHTQLVAVSNLQNVPVLKNLVNRFSIFKILSDFAEPAFSLTLREAQSHHDFRLQSQELSKIQDSLRSKLFNAHLDLEQKLKERQLQRADYEIRKSELLFLLRLLQKSLIRIFEAQSVPEIQRQIDEVLRENPKIRSARISYARRQGDTLSSKYPIQSDGRPVGALEIQSSDSLSGREDHLLHRVAEAIGLAFERLAKLDQAESLKQEWEMTFDAISDPFSIVDEDYHLIRLNRSFARRASAEAEDLVGRKCHEVLFGRDNPCEGCHLGKDFKLPLVRSLDGHWRSFEVTSQQLEGQRYIMHYGDQTNRLRMLKRVSETAKLSELGTIGGSIAHELNNPIAGMLTFTQLIKMDLKGNETYYEDIIELEKGILRCRDIVQSLLSFTRKPDLQTMTEFDLKDAIQEALQVVGVRTRSGGVQLELSLPQESVLIKGQKNLLAHALVNLLQDSIEAVERHKRFEPQAQARVQIQVRVEEKIVLEILDNGLPHSLADSHQLTQPVTSVDNERLTPGLGLTLAYQIIEQHGGSLEFLEGPGPRESSSMRTQAKISFARPVF